jgi:NitT/TauT family transport system substrate-binding protein
MASGKLTTFSKVLFVAVPVAILAVLLFTGVIKLPGGERPMRVCVVTWGGYAGGQYYNNGFGASTDSRYFKDFGIKVEFVLNDDVDASFKAWEAGEIDVMWTTADCWSTNATDLSSYNPKIFFQSDWSRGGDALVVVRGINSVNDLKHKRIAVAFKTPSHSFLLWMLQSAGMKVTDVEIVEVASAIDAAAAFKAGQVEAAVVWSPDDELCQKAVPDSRVLKSTKEARYIIADVFFAKADYVKAHQKDLTKLVQGWLTGAAEINSNPAAKDKAAEILATGLNISVTDAKLAIENTRLCTYGDNRNFFDLDGRYQGVKGQDIYEQTGRIYQQIGFIRGSFPDWRSVIDVSIIKGVKLEGNMHAAEAGIQYAKPTAAIAQAPASAWNPVNITFPSGSWTLENNAKTILDTQIAPYLKKFEAYVRVTGNTDNVGDYQMNMDLSRKRAQSVVDYLVSKHGINVNRFYADGKGPNNPIGDNNTEDGRAMNRRTDFELVKQ